MITITYELGNRIDLFWHRLLFLVSEMKCASADALKKRLPDTSLRPPGVLTALGSKLYPMEDLKLDPSISVPAALRVRSLIRKREEASGYIENKGDFWLDHRDQFSYRERYCEICSEAVSSVREEIKNPVIHRHESSLLYRIDSRKTDYWGDYPCKSCRVKYHSHHYGSRYPILATSSTLAGWQGNREQNGYEGDNIHVEIVAIPGGHVQNVHHAVVAEYRGMGRPLDVLAVTGLNNLAAGHTPILVMDEFEQFRNEVLDIDGSSFSVATLPFPPSLSRLPEDNFRHSGNITEDLTELNFLIRDFNREGNQPMNVEWSPLFHTWGLKSAPSKKIIGPRNLMELLPSHNQKEWRESRPQNQMHLNDHLRLKMGKSVVTYFKKIYEA